MSVLDRLLPLVELAEIAAYGGASAIYLAYHAGLRDRVGRLARAIFLAGFALHLVDIGGHCFRGQHPLSSTPEATTFVAWLVAGGFLLASFRYRLAAAGAFAAPAVLVLVLLARVLPGGPDIAKLGPLAHVHIFLSTVGEALFAFAAILAVLYLVQERQLKRKEFARIKHAGTAPLDTLDRLATRSVQLGFPIFTLAIVTGAVLVARLGLLQGGSGVRVEYLVAVVSWLAFGVLLIARVGVGWSGRRAAYLTLGGFAGALLVLVGYFLRAVA